MQHDKLLDELNILFDVEPELGSEGARMSAGLDDDAGNFGDSEAGLSAFSLCDAPLTECIREFDDLANAMHLLTPIDLIHYKDTLMAKGLLNDAIAELRPVLFWLHLHAKDEEFMEAFLHTFSWHPIVDELMNINGD